MIKLPNKVAHAGVSPVSRISWPILSRLVVWDKPLLRGWHEFHKASPHRGRSRRGRCALGLLVSRRICFTPMSRMPALIAVSRACRP
jgi:hypothetical protein